MFLVRVEVFPDTILSKAIPYRGLGSCPSPDELGGLLDWNSRIDGYATEKWTAPVDALSLLP